MFICYLAWCIIRSVLSFFFSCSGFVKSSGICAALRTDCIKECIRKGLWQQIINQCERKKMEYKKEKVPERERERGRKARTSQQFHAILNSVTVLLLHCAYS